MSCHAHLPDKSLFGSIETDRPRPKLWGFVVCMMAHIRATTFAADVDRTWRWSITVYHLIYRSKLECGMYHIGQEQLVSLNMRRKEPSSHNVVPSYSNLRDGTCRRPYVNVPFQLFNMRLHRCGSFSVFENWNWSIIACFSKLIKHWAKVEHNAHI